ncbi:MAG: hypothetical protein JO332_11395 [Planctomycetaceae bacterium]|nr:hypothetical protein [Planctomycetaceae bacterium]
MGKRFGILIQTCAATLLTALAGHAETQAGPRADWQEFRSEPGNFLLWVPGKPEELKVEGCAPGAQVWQASGDSLLTVFQFGYIGRQERVRGTDRDRLLGELVQETADRMKGTVVSSDRITLSGWPGRESRIKFAAGEIPMCMIDRLYLIRDTKLFVRIVVPEERAGNADHRKILDSFKLIDEAKCPRE